MVIHERERVQEEGLIDIVDIVQKCLVIAKKMWLQIVVLTIAFAVLMGVYAKRSFVEYYTAYTVLTVTREWDVKSDETSSYYDNVTAEQLASVFPHILTSDLLRRQVAQDMGSTGVSGAIYASVTPNTNILTISVTDVNPQRAYDTLQSILNNYPAISEVIIGKTTTTVLDETGVPEKPNNTFDMRRSVIKGAVMGFGLAMVWVALVAFTRKTICKEEDMKKRMNIPYFGAVPEIRKKVRSKKHKEASLLITNEKNEAVLQEPFRMIRNKVEYAANEANKKTFLVTSALAGEGKSTFAVNLALSLAKNRKKVVLMDCDLRHPSSRSVLGLEDGKGLAEVLKREVKFTECVMKSTQLGLDPHMQFLYVPGGEAVEDGSEFLSSPMMQNIIEKMEVWADYVIIDSAPVGLLTDAAVFAEKVDGAIFVVRQDHSSVNDILDGMEFLTDSGIEIIGGVLNGV